YEASEHARLEVVRATHPVDTQAAGRVIAVNLTLDTTVQAGDVLVELDAATERLQLAEARAKASGIAPQVDATRKPAIAEERALTAYRDQLGATLLEAEGHLKEGQILSSVGKIEAERSERLLAAGLVPEAEVTQKRGEFDRRRASEASLQATVERLRR